jgi:hypothetical protein
MTGLGAKDWTQIIAGVGQGAGSAIQGTYKSGQSKKEAKEAKKRTLANLLNSAMRRNQALFRAGQEYGDETSDYRAKSLQNVARGFVDSLHGAGSLGKGK